MLAEGSTPREASEALGPQLSSQRHLFAIATHLREIGDANAADPDPGFQEALAARLRAGVSDEAAPARIATRPRRPLVLVPLAAAACILLFAALLVPAMRSLPGDRLYGLKGFSEDARLVFATGAVEARVRVDLADERFSEVERLIERSSVQAMPGTVPGTFAAPGTFAGVTDISDPELGRLIEDALSEAGKHLQAAVDILTSQPSLNADLDELVQVSRRGHDLATQVADDLPTPASPPVLSTVVKLAKIEAAAKAARTRVRTKPTPPPCATPTPTPTPEPTATPEGEPDETATSTAVESPLPSPTDTPKPTPCTTPEPTPTPEPTKEPAPITEPTAAPGVEQGVEGDDGSEEAGANDDGQGDQASAADPFDA